MDAQDPAIQAEINRRVTAIQQDERGDVSHEPLSKGDLWGSLIVVVVMTIIGLVVLI